MLSEFHISVASSRDVEVALYLVSNDTAVDTAAIGLTAHAWCLAELALPRLAQLLMYVLNIIPSSLFIFAQFVCPTFGVLAGPLRPRCWVFAQEFAS